MSDMKTAQPLHSESITFLDALKRLNLKPYYELETIAEARSRSKRVSMIAGQVDYDGTRTEIIVPQPGVPEGIPVWVYNPRAVVANPPILVYLHGGGNVVGCRENVDTMCKIISSGTSGIVVNVEYRLAPEHKFPDGLNDACGVTQWVLDNRTTVGGSRTSKVGVAGDSAGAQLATAVGHDVPGLAFEILIYTHVSIRGDHHLPSFQEYKDGPILDSKLIDWFENLMGDKSEWANPRFANILRDKFDHLPPTLLIVAECDPLRDDSYEYAKKLSAAGVLNEMHLAKGAIHGFFTIPGAFPELCKEAHGKAIDFIKRFGLSD